MDRSAESFDVGIIVGRFQVYDLTDGHKKLVDNVVAEHKEVAIFLGLSPCKCSVNNPLDFETRKLMIKEAYPNVEVYYIKDNRSDVVWSDSLDNQIFSIYKHKSVCLYGSRDSFLQYYSGKLPCRELLQEVFTSGTEQRKELAKRVTKSMDFRHGAIWAVYNQYAQALPTIDLGIFNKDFSRILLARKAGEDLFRLVGGFVEPGETYEETAVREAKEESGVDVKSLSYVKSFVIDDWRYKAEVNKITTTLFKTNDWSGNIGPLDEEIAELRWFPFNKHILGSLVKEHIEMMKSLLEG